MTLGALTPHHRSQVIERAHAWRMNNHPRILALMKGHWNGREPTGAMMFDPALWDAESWIWFSDLVLERAQIRMGANPKFANGYP